MHTLTASEVTDQPNRLLDDAQRGQSDIVMVEAEPVMLTAPLGPGAGIPAAPLELAVALYESDQISLRRAAKVAGLAYGRMVDELGRRGIPAVRYGADDLEREPEHVRTLAGPR